ncbi:Bud-site selection protein [Mycena alexandri]|uniref:Bud-site selection protein n=1 Tax=Mycena alexandri TaxID=1745969 RepID=A0AAD6STC8_9AGAR|nr:Bud-site selection protein [Mycena alexandri]
MNAASTSTAPRGTKRKRPDTTAEDPATKLAGKLHHELKEVRKAAKKARTFETQRVVKKLKGLRKKDPATPEVAVLEAELEELKTIDPDAIGATALRTRLLKDRHIADSAPACAAIARELPPPAIAPPTPNSKVQARLFSHRALGAAVSEAIAGLRAVLLPPKTEAQGGDVEMGEAEDEGEDDEAEVDAEHEEEEEEEEEDGADAAGWESGSVRADSDEDDGEDDDGWESGSVHSDAPAPPPSKKKASAAAAAIKPSAKTKAAPATKSTPATTSSSQFLPSLAVGYIRGGSSDSDFEEDVDVDAGGERKNRRGQRARRAIWEKKFGRGANHKKKEAEEAAKVQIAVKAKWEARRAAGEATPNGSGNGNGAGKGRGKGRWTESAQGQASAPPQGHGQARPAQAPGQGQGRGLGRGKPAAAADAGLHPSWAAKKALKEKMGGSGGAIVPSQGKKIVFA